MRAKISIEPMVYPLWAFLLLTVPLDLLLSWGGAAVIHEIGHILAQRSFTKSVLRIRVGMTGAVIMGEDLGTARNIICVLAGPALGISPVIFARSLPKLALCALLLSVYNILPLYPLDGGRILRMIGEKYGAAEKTVCCIEWGAVLFFAFWAVRYRSVLPMMPVIPYLREKLLAKRRNSGYNSSTIEMR